MTHPWETEGDEWARGTPYESPEEAALRAFLDGLRESARAMSIAMAEMQRACRLGRDLYVVTQFVRLGLTRAEAEVEVLAARAGASSPTGEVRLIKARFRELAD